jgi:hypothetical protein
MLSETAGADRSLSTNACAQSTPKISKSWIDVRPCLWQLLGTKRKMSKRTALPHWKNVGLSFSKRSDTGIDPDC